MNAIARIPGSFIILSVIFLLSLFVAGWTKEYAVLAIPFVILVFYAGWMNVNVAFFLLLITLVFSFEYNFTPSMGTDIPDEGLMILTSVLFIAYWIYKPESISRDVWRHPLLLLLAIHLGWILTTVIISTDPRISFFS